MNPLAIVAFIEALIQAGVEGIQAWQQVSAMVQAKRAPTAEEWAALGKSVDEAEAAIQALT